jgi:4-diphosphocytidyl-2C-methyl-D-erythritol kinase
MRVPAPAKINLHLRVGPRQADGFHPLLTWMTTISLFDSLTFVRRPPQPKDGEAPLRDAHQDAPRDLDWFTLSCDRPSLPCGNENLVVKAATAMADAFDAVLQQQQQHPGSRVGEGRTVRSGRVSAFLAKRIPSGGGLGGGSSDAASTLLALNALWKFNWPAARLSAIASALGSDVPFFLFGASSICRGRGEIVRPLDSPGMKWATLVLPPIELSTAAVYRRFDEMNLGRDDAVGEELDWPAWSRLPAAELMPRLVNDLEPPAFALRPELGELRSNLQRELSQVVRMSGSGSSLFVLRDDPEWAESDAKRIRERYKESGVGAMAVQVAPARHAK